MKKLLCVSTFLAATIFANAQPANPMPLWSNGAPGAMGTADKDIPTLTAYLPTPESATGAAMVICPGGGYGGLAAHEGEAYALFLKDHGIAGFVLKYRLGSSGYRHPAMLQDVSRAIRTVRAKADEWRLDPKRIGVMGSSAGGHLASTVLTHFDSGKADAEDPIDRQSSRPDLGVLCYPVISMGEKGHAGSRKNLLGDNPSADLIKDLSNELQVTKETPPCFLFHTVEDSGVPVENSLIFASALRAAGVPFDLHIYEKGPHGMGLGFKVYSPYEPDKLHPWTRDCIFWLKEHKFAK
ncbi:MAG: alpha/beta hydrolase [Verrucomicrobiota bacterium]